MIFQHNHHCWHDIHQPIKNPANSCSSEAAREDSLQGCRVSYCCKLALWGAGSRKRVGFNSLPVTHNDAACCPLGEAKTLNRRGGDPDMKASRGLKSTALSLPFASHLLSSCWILLEQSLLCTPAPGKALMCRKDRQSTTA